MVLYRISVVVLLLANQLSAAQTSTKLSDVFYLSRVTGGFSIFKWERFDIYDRHSPGKDVYVGTVRSGQPAHTVASFGGADLTQKQFAVAADGNSIVFVQANFLAPRPSHLEGGIYLYEHGGTPRMLHPVSELGGDHWRRWPKPIPSDVLPFDHPTTKHVVWAVTPDGNEFPLALLNGGKLHEAALDGRTEECVSLVEKGAALDGSTYWGFTPLELAVIADHEDTAVQLLQLGADPLAGTSPPLHEALLLGRLRVVEEMLAKGVDVNALDGYGISALSVAAMVSGDRGDFSMFFERSETPRTIVDQQLATQLIRLLIEHGADGSFRNRHGKIPLDYVTRFTPPEAIELLLAASTKN